MDSIVFENNKLRVFELSVFFFPYTNKHRSSISIAASLSSSPLSTDPESTVC